MKGSMLKRSARAKPSARERNKFSSSSPSKMLFQDPVGHELPASLHSFRWNVDKVERKIQEKIQEKTKIAGNFVYQQAYRLLECTRGEGIDYVSFKEQLRIKFGIILEDGELQLLFDKYDEDRNGTIDLNEFIRRVLPPDYNYGRQWFEISQQQSDDKQAALKRESRNEFLMGMGIVKEDIENTGEATHWTLDNLMKMIQIKVVQKTPSGDDQYRRAFKMLRCGRDQGIRMKELRNNLKTKFGIFISERQMKELFSQFDKDGSGEIDLKEFLQLIEPLAYPDNSKVPRGLWTAEEDEEEEENGGEEGEEKEHGGQVGAVDEDECSQEGANHDHHRRRHLNDHRHPNHYHSHSHHHERPGSAARGGSRGYEDDRHGRGASPAGSGSGSGSGSGPSTSTKNVIKKERPMSANPKKQAMLKQRREQMASTGQLRMDRHMKETEMPPHQQGGHRSVTKASGSQSRGRLSMSMADIHHVDRPSTADGAKQQHRAAAHYQQHHAYNYRTEDDAAVADDCGLSVCSGASTSSYLVGRPRSAGSVASSRPSSAASASSSVRGAAYMRRPSTPQHLRQKCLESRLAGATTTTTGLSDGGVRKDPQSQHKLKKRVASTGSHGHPVAAAVHSVHTSGGGDHVRFAKKSAAIAQRERDACRHCEDHEYPYQVDEDEGEEDGNYEPPRVVRVHPKQCDNRPFSQEGKVLLRSKVSSAGCR